MSGEIDITKGYNWNTSGETVTAAKLNSTALPVAKVQQGAITNVEIADGTISADKIDSNLASQLSLEDDAVTTAKILNSAVTTAKINALAVTTAKIAADAVTGAKIADESIDSDHYVDGSIDAAHLASSAVETAKINDDAVTPAKTSGMFVHTGYMRFVETQTTTTAGSASVASTWTKRVVNSEVTDIGAQGSVASSVITLEAGKYFCNILCPAWDARNHQARLRDTTAGANLIIGTAAESGDENDLGEMTYSIINGYFSLGVQSTLEIQHNVRLAATDGFGRPSSRGEAEIYLTAEFWQIDVTDLAVGP